MSATDELRRMLDERGVEYDTDDEDGCEFTEWIANGLEWEADGRGELVYLTPAMLITPEQAIAATLGREQIIDPVWEQWHDGLRHAEIKTIGDAVEQLMYESIEHGGDMGPNGITYYGIDEGEVATLDFIDDWIEKFEALLGG